jgi:hypothetical protein
MWRIDFFFTLRHAARPNWLLLHTLASSLRCVFLSRPGFFGLHRFLIFGFDDGTGRMVQRRRYREVGTDMTGFVLALSYLLLLLRVSSDMISTFFSWETGTGMGSTGGRFRGDHDDTVNLALLLPNNDIPHGTGSFFPSLRGTHRQGVDTGMGCNGFLSVTGVHVWNGGGGQVRSI